MATQLEILADKFRQENISKNPYTNKGIYSSMHENALATGDEKGKGENDGKIGSNVDINSRIDSLARNTYNSSNEYSDTNRNALSDGDDKGKGENSGQVGSLTDINTRTSLLTKNIYGTNFGYGVTNPNAISGIFYLKLPKKQEGETEFHLGGNKFKLPSNELNWFIFPSNYLHIPGKLSSNAKRYVISFDVWFN